MIAAGQLRQLVEIQKPSTTDDAAGGKVPAWPLVVSLHVRIVPLVGRELYEAQQNIASVTHRIETRWIDGINETMRVKYGARLFNINNIINVEERGFEMHLLCTEQKPANT